MRGVVYSTKLKETPKTYYLILLSYIKESVPGCEGPGTKGKQPRSLDKVLKKKAKGERGLFSWDSQKVGLEAAILERKRNSSMV